MRLFLWGSLMICSILLNAQDPELNKLRLWMSGDFSSRAQHQRDTSFFDIRLHMRPIWTERSDGFWLYVEQSLASSQAKPYRQRIYQVRRLNDSILSSQVYEMKNPLRFVRAWQDPSLLGNLSPDSLETREGCAILLRINAEGNFVGTTPEKSCLSRLRGASYATSEVIITRNLLVSWDRGWDAGDKQVWGSTKGGYHFRKQRRKIF